jgi:hypothetical protein
VVELWDVFLSQNGGEDSGLILILSVSYSQDVDSIPCYIGKEGLATKPATVIDLQLESQ